MIRRILQTRSFAAVLFRRIASKTRKIPGTDESKELFLALQEPEKLVIRQKLLECLGTETRMTDHSGDANLSTKFGNKIGKNDWTANLRNKIGDAVAEIARQYADDGKGHALWVRQQ